MTPRLSEQTRMPDEPLAEALGETLASNEDLPRYSVVAHWPGLARCTLDDEQKTSTSLQRAEHLDDPHLQYPFAVSPYDDRMAILHLDVCLHADDRELTGPEWAEVARRLARAAGILLHLADEARRIEQTLRLIPVRTELATKPTSAATARLAGVLLLADEKSGAGHAPQPRRAHRTSDDPPARSCRPTRCTARR